MGPVFYKKKKKKKKNPWTCVQFSDWAQITKFVKNGPIFQEKSLMGTLFCQNDP